MKGVHINYIERIAQIILAIPKTIDLTNILETLLFLQVNLFAAPPLGVLRVHSKGIENVTIGLKVPENYGFHSNITIFLFFTYHPFLLHPRGTVK